MRNSFLCKQSKLSIFPKRLWKFFFIISISKSKSISISKSIISFLSERLEEIKKNQRFLFSNFQNQKGNFLKLKSTSTTEISQILPKNQTQKKCTKIRRKQLYCSIKKMVTIFKEANYLEVPLHFTSLSLSSALLLTVAA